MLTYDHIKRLLFRLNPETAHNITEFTFKNSIKFCPFLASRLVKKYFITDARLEQKLFGTTFLNPIGLGAGFDKNATMIKMLTALGFGHVEFGTITPKPQTGNPKPRLFRYTKQESLQNAMGFNNGGMKKIKSRVEKLYPFAIPIVANIGKNKTTSNENALDDYEKLIETFKNISDYMVVNISSPNTKGLRDLQNEEFIKKLFTMAKRVTNKSVLLKISPDLKTKDAINICNVALENGAGGIVATNTTTDYSLLPNSQNFGGISGAVLEKKSSDIFEQLAKEFYGKTTLISVGGISSAKTAYDRIKMGASLIQIYSSFIFKGPKLNKEISQGILDLMDRDGFTHISEVVGVDRK
ncbi:MAG: quinone-dependent dihydroorotate dehydrogenase [Sulfurospirillum sp.]|nr:quinone-dependent dihydroorotate dehydrogenase [Sulfurospirillum sp.]MBL0703405.1 quinone-dependent dihydroorotate dehydrogenase [Sulfurospirillum sp.]